MSLQDHVNKQTANKDTARQAIFEAIEEQAKNLQDYGDAKAAAEGLRNLAEAAAWLIHPAQSH
ncbi:hypothetical protein ACFWZK_29000 [[Kitasatospora] papulosa]|uniref:hypothetical protein n=1 Tax=[Kitasatospora] papulosa TaxID=1464011 RepID=UPI0036C68B10